MPSAPAAKSSPPRRTQAQRRAHTRGRLLDAAIECLVEQGYAAVTTAAIASRAGVSQGAIFKHYPTKAALLIAATERLYARIRAEFEAEIVRRAAGRDRIDAALELLWSVFASPEVTASLELGMAARTDAELRAALAPMSAAHRAAIHATARSLFPEATARNPRFDTYIDVVLSTLQGAVAGAPAHDGPQRSPELLDALRWLAHSQLAMGEE